MMEYAVKVYCEAGQDLYHASKLYTGLCSLGAEGRVVARFVAPRRRGEAALALDPLVVCMAVTSAATGETRLAAFDLYDRSDVINRDLLGACDVYFKRSFHEPDLAVLPPSSSAKVVPFGLNYGCASRSALARAALAFGRRSVLRALRHAGAGAGRPGDGYRVVRNFASLPRPAEFERGPGDDLDPVVVYQTRVWDPSDTGPDDAEALNESRVRLVRALREAFGGRFRGGLVRTEFARRAYPDVLTAHDSGRRHYAEMSRRCLVGVYTRGLHHSVAFKLPEYLASSKCIVSEPIRNALPLPLAEGSNLLTFSSPEECVRRCETLLGDPDFAAAMRRANHDYYREQVEPGAHVMNCLRRLMADRDEMVGDRTAAGEARPRSAGPTTIRRSASST